jgi:hypothetical protein
MIVASLSVLVVALKNPSSSTRCSLDGSRIDPFYEVNIFGEKGTLYSFSCVLSARIWLMGNSERASAIWVTDEVTGEKIRAELAYYVESDIMTTPHVRNRIHVFAQKAVADSHARHFSGAVVPNPLAVPRQKVVHKVRYKKGNDNRSNLCFSPSQKPLCLVDRTASKSALGVTWLSKRQPHRLMKGYGNPPEKPPQCVL